MLHHWNISESDLVGGDLFENQYISNQKLNEQDLMLHNGTADTINYNYQPR